MSIIIPPAFFNPKQFPTLVAWYDGNDPNGTGVQPNDGDAIATWKDKAGNNDQVQNTGANKLIWKANIQNGRGVMRSTALKFMTGGAMNMPSGSGARTVFLVGMTTDSSKNNVFYDWGTNAGNQHCAFLFTTFVTNPRFINDLSGNYSQEVDVAITNNTYYRCSMNYPGGGAPSTANYTMNGVPTAKSSGGSGANPNTGSTGSEISSYLGAGTGSEIYGDICEIMVYNTSLNAAQMNAVLYYLHCKWGV